MVNCTLYRPSIIFFVGCLALLLAAPAAVTADPNDDDDGDDSSTARASVQERFAPKTGRFFVHAGGVAMVRDDFYHSFGYGLDGGYYFNETLGVEARAYNLHSRLSHAGRRLRDDYSFVPDLRAPDAHFALGIRTSWGYGKILSFGRFVVHFDPQWTLHGGITLAEERIAPTVSTGLGFLTHWRYGIQAKLDLQMNLHLEQRSRGMVPAFGFLPMLTIGWSPPGDRP